jgi:6-phosphogluconolactonase
MSKTPRTIHQAQDAATLAQDLARFVVGCLRGGLARRGQALLVVSGGSTPVPFFEALAEADLDWPRVAITLADERWVPPVHADSNERLVRTHLLRGPAAQAHFVSLLTQDASAALGLPTVESRVEGLPWPADVVILGMGGDAHTASLFPHAPELAQALDESRPECCVAVGVPSPPNVQCERISLTQRALLDTHQLVVHVTGSAKRMVLEQALKEGAVQSMPIRLALHQTRIPCEVFYST